jgi:hypothetical protein
MNCANCATPIEGDFCSQCGQRTKEFNVPVREFAQDFASEALSLDSRLLTTLKPLFFKPGAVPRDYVAGHRARFVPPVRLYVFASVAMFLLMTLGSGLTSDNITVGPNAVDAASGASQTEAETETAPTADSQETGEMSFERRLETRMIQGLQRADQDSRAFTRDFVDWLAQAMFFLLPAFAVLLKMVYRRRLYVQHLVFTVYYYSFVFLVVAFMLLPDAVGLGWITGWLQISLLAVPPYLLLGMKRFYAESWLKTVAKFVFVSAAYGFMSGVVMVAVLLLSLMAV